MTNGTLGRYIREKRLQRGISLRELANCLGMQHAFLSQIETGRRNPPARVVEKMAKALEVPAEELRARNSVAALVQFRRMLAKNPQLSIAFARLVKAVNNKEISISDLISCFSEGLGQSKKHDA